MEKLKNVEIKSTKILADILSLIQKLVKNSKVEQVWLADNPFASKQDVSSIAVNGPWPDYIEMYFKELDSKKLFKLSVETFHGAGGKLEEV